MSGQQQQLSPSPPVHAGYHNDGAGDDDGGNHNGNLNYDINSKAPASRQQAGNTKPKRMRRSTHGSLSSRAGGGGGGGGGAGARAGGAASRTTAPRQKNARIMGIPRWTLGIALLLVTVLMWTTSSFLASVCLLSTSLRFIPSSPWGYCYGATFRLLFVPVTLSLSKRIHIPSVVNFLLRACTLFFPSAFLPKSERWGLHF